MEALIPDVVLSLNRSGLFVEIPVDQNSAPYLVSKTRGLLWLEGCHNGVIRSAVVQGGLPDTAYADLVREIRDRGTSQKLENSFPMTQQGACSAIDYLRFYDLENLEILSSDPDFESPPLDEGVRVVHAKWVPPGCGVVVPADRSYLGMVGIFKGAYTLVVHNPTRGLAILGSW